MGGESLEASSTPVNENLARYSVFMGIAGLVMWVFPLIGLPVSVASLVLGWLGLGSNRKDMARSGISLGIIGCVVTIVYMVLIFYIVSAGFLPELV